MTIRGLVLNQPPAAVKQQQDFPNGSPQLLNLLLSKDALPFRQSDWPLPMPIPVNPALWGFTDSTRFRLIGKDALPFRQTDWPTPPKAREIPPALYGFTGSYLLNLIGKDALPIRQQEWPLPKGREINPALWGFIDVSRIWLPTVAVQSPFNQADWPNPIPAAYVPALLGFTDSFKLELIGQDALPFSQSDWQFAHAAPWVYPDYSVNLLPLGQSTPTPTPTPTPPATGGDDVPRRRKSPHKGFDLEAWKARQQDFEGTIRKAYDELMRGPHAEEVRDIVAPHLETDPDVQRDIDWQALFADYRAISDMIQIHEAQMMEEEAIVSLLIH